MADFGVMIKYQTDHSDEIHHLPDQMGEFVLGADVAVYGLG